MIPKILAQTWKSADLPTPAAELQRGWRSLNPDFAYRFYDDAQCREVIAETFPQHLAAYDSLPHSVMRADLFRYAVIYRNGGVYADIDMECLRPIGGLLSEASCLLSIEAHLGRTRQRELGYPEALQIANCIFAASPREPLFREAVDRGIVLFESLNRTLPLSIEDITGPRMLTRLFFERSRPHVTVLPQIVLMAPLSYPNIWPLNRHMHARHQTFGTWKTGSQHLSPLRKLIERNCLPNPLRRNLPRSIRSTTGC
jgi:mannosyltransferase OCH1-like enzyme